jgi:hypothetical protein
MLEKNDFINIILNILIAFCIGIIIGRQIFNTIKYKGPDSNEIKKQIHQDNDGKGKYKWKPKVCICPISHSMFKLKDVNFMDDH